MKCNRIVLVVASNQYGANCMKLKTANAKTDWRAIPIGYNSYHVSNVICSHLRE